MSELNLGFAIIIVYPLKPPHIVIFGEPNLNSFLFLSVMGIVSLVCVYISGGLCVFGIDCEMIKICSPCGVIDEHPHGPCVSEPPLVLSVATRHT